MPGTQSCLLTVLCRMANLERENSALRAEVEQLKNTLCLCQIDREHCSGNATVLHALLQELLKLAVLRERSVRQKYLTLEVWSVGPPSKKVLHWKNVLQNYLNLSITSLQYISPNTELAGIRRQIDSQYPLKTFGANGLG